MIIIFSFQVFTPNVLAQDEESLKFTPQVPIPGSEFGDESVPVGESAQSKDPETDRQITTVYSTLLPRYIKAIYNYGIGIAAFLALAMIVAGGLIWLTSAGSTEKIGTARSMIVSAVIGLVILLATYTLLQILSPALLNFKPIETEYIGALKLGCCQIEKQDETNIARNATNKECETLVNNDAYKTSTFYPGYSATADGTQCLQDGCCIIVTETAYTGTVSNNTIWTEKTNCIDANEVNCETIQEERYSSDLTSSTRIKNSDFEQMSCSQVTDYDCTIVNCEGVKNGRKCPGNINDCRCYDETPFYGEGNEGEPCGNDEGKCFGGPPQVINGSCSGNWSKDRSVWSGRTCKDGLECCFNNQ